MVFFKDDYGFFLTGTVVAGVLAGVTTGGVTAAGVVAAGLEFVGVAGIVATTGAFDFAGVVLAGAIPFAEPVLGATFLPASGNFGASLGT
jgi:hypothetical protein